MLLFTVKAIFYLFYFVCFCSALNDAAPPHLQRNYNEYSPNFQKAFQQNLQFNCKYNSKTFPIFSLALG